MRNINLLLLLAMAGSVGGNACAMGQEPMVSPRCVVSGADRLPDGIGGGEAICAAIEEAGRRSAAGVDFAVEVAVRSDSSLSARIRLNDGRTLPEQKMAVSDRQLNAGSIARFASVIAQAVAAGAEN